MSLKLRPHQIQAVKKCRTGCILNGGVGSGKTLTALAYFYIQNGGSWDYLNGGEYVKMNNPKDLIIITTAAVRDKLSWNKELIYFYMYPNPESNFYKDQTIIIDSWNNIKKYMDKKDCFFIFDEDRITGSGVWVRAFYKIAEKNEWIVLSATAGDTYMDYFPIFKANGFFRTKTEFIENHVVYSRFTVYPKIDRYIDTRRLERLRDRILIPMDFERHTTRHHEDIYCDFDSFLYRDTVKKRWNPFKDEPIEQAAGLCYVLRKIVNSDPSRAEAVLKLSKKHPKLIIFYNHDYERDILLNISYGDDYEVAEWTGHKHQPVPDSDKWVYIVNYTAGAEGWNCIKTDAMIFYSQTYSWKTLEQACGRIDRMNTPFYDLYYYHLKSRSSIDLSIARTLKTKKRFNERKFAGWD